MARSKKPRKSYADRVNRLKRQELTKAYQEQKHLEQIKTENELVLLQKHTLSMEFNDWVVKNRLVKYCEDNGLEFGSDGLIFPYDVVIDAYDQQDLIIALKMMQVECLGWRINCEMTLHDQDDNEIGVMEYPFTLPAMTYQEAVCGSKKHINRGGGIKTRWLGFSTELSKAALKVAPEAYALGQCNYRFECDVRFLSINCYKEYLKLIEAREKGQLLEVIKNIDKFEVEYLKNKAA